MLLWYHETIFSRKPSECCEDRYDDCSVRIKDSLCYCDEFCLNKDDTTGLHDDCCPDFREVCLGIIPPEYQADEPTSQGIASLSTSLKCILLEQMLVP